MHSIPAHKQTNPAAYPAQIINGYTPAQRQALQAAALAALTLAPAFPVDRSERSLHREASANANPFIVESDFCKR